MVYNFGNPFPPSVGSFQVPVPPPDSDPDDGDMAVVCFSQAWQPYVLGALQQLTLQATWQGDNATVLLAQSRAQDLLDLFSQVESVCAGTMIVRGLRYVLIDDQVQQTTDGGISYHDADQLDPRHSTTFQYPAVEADDPRCQAAANMTRYISNLIDATVENLSIGLGVSGLATLLLPFLIELGPFGLLFDLVLALALELFNAGATAVSSAFTNDVYDQLTCIFFCSIENDGTVTPDDLSLIQTRISSDIGGLVSVILDAMLFLMGEVGLTNAGTQGSAPADCDDCGCGWCYLFDLTVDDGGFVADTYGHWESGRGWVSDTVAGLSQAMIISRTFPDADVTHYEMTTCFDVTGSGIGAGRYVDLRESATILSSSSGGATIGCEVQGADGTWTANKVLANPSGSMSSGNIVITSCKLRGTGTNPFGADNC